MESKAVLRFVRMAPQKGRLVADMVRGEPVDQALALLRYSRSRAAAVIRKVVESAIANAENNEGADIDELHVSRIYVDQGPTMKRTMPRAKGRADRILKRTSHVTVYVADR